MTVQNERGFTLIELAAVTVVVLLLLVASLFFLRADNYTVPRQDARRRVDLAHIVQAINRYVADTGHLPPNIPSKVTAISSGKNQYNLCSVLVPKYISDLPMDPAYGIRILNDQQSTANCSTSGMVYSSGYGIQRDSSGRVGVSAPLANNGTITVYVPNSANLQ